MKAPTLTAPIAYRNQSLVKPQGSTSPGTTPLTPTSMRAAYGLGAIGDSNVTFNGVQGDGAGQTIAILAGGQDPTIASDLASFDNYYGLPAPASFSQLNQSGGTDLTGVPVQNSVETALDVEWSHVMAPAASIILYSSNSIYSALTTAKNTVGVSVISISYNISGTQSDTFYRTPTSRGTSGVTVLAASGDKAGAVAQPGESNSVISVGGTYLTLNSTGGYGSETTWSDAGSGLNTSEAQPGYQAIKAAPYTTKYRATPDVSIDADPSSGVAIYDTTGNTAAAPWTDYLGGTSLATPLMAGIIAVADQGRVAAGLGTLDGYSQTLPRLYTLPSSAFNDITTGADAYPAEPGYDLATGLGTPVANNLIPDLAGAATVTGTAFEDVNADGVYDTGDTVLANKTVYLDLNGNGVQGAGEPSTTTNSSGVYKFTDQLGGLTGNVRLTSAPAGYPYLSTATTFTTSYDAAQTVNLGYTVANLGPAITVAAAATPSPVTAKSTALSVTATDTLHGANNLAYTWAATTLPAEAANPTFTANATNAARLTTATFTKAGTYVFTVTATDTAGLSTYSNVTVTVNQTLTGLTISPLGPNLTAGQTQQLTAVQIDQFGNTMTSSAAIMWSLTSGGGSISSTGLYTSPGSGTLAVVTAATGSISTTTNVYVVSSPWTSVDVGAPALAGSGYDIGSGYPADTFTLTGAGNDVYGTSDQFHYVYQTLTGDATIIARVASQTRTAQAAKAGVDIRASTAAGAAHVAMELTAGKGPEFLARTATGGSTTSVLGSSSIKAPYYVKLTRVGDVFTGYVSSTGASWTMISSATVVMTGAIDIGLMDAAVNSAALGTDVFDHVAIGPTIAAAASASPATVTGATTALSALGADTYGEANLTYSWAATTAPSGAALPTFSADATNASKATTATFYAAGAYTFTVTIKDAAGLTVTSSVQVTVGQTLTAISLMPAGASIVPTDATQQFTASQTDQFGVAIASPAAVTWSLDAGSIGSISTTGLYTAPSSTGNAVVRGTVGNISGSSNVSVVDATPPTLVSVVSRKTQGSAGTFDLPLSLDSNSATIEPRAGGASTLVFTFSEPMLAATGMLSAANFNIINGTYASATLSGAILILNLNGVVDQATLSVSLAGLIDTSGNALAGTNSVAVRDLVGDVNQSGSVNIIDQSIVKSNLLRPVNDTDFLFDINGDGLINVIDQSIAKSDLNHFA